MPQWIRPARRWAVYLRDGLTCQYCGAHLIALTLVRGSFLVLDHVQAQSAGGGHGWSNLVTACYNCNLLKARTGQQEWLEVLKKDVGAWHDAHRRRAEVGESLFRHRAAALLRWRPYWFQGNANAVRAHFAGAGDAGESPPEEEYLTAVLADCSIWTGPPGDGAWLTP